MGRPAFEWLLGEPIPLIFGKTTILLPVILQLPVITAIIVLFGIIIPVLIIIGL